MVRKIDIKNNEYWSGRAEGYSQVNREELEGVQNGNWSGLLDTRIRGHFPDRDRSSIRVLDVGTGPGFFSIILTRLGYDVTAVDYTESMLEKAKENAGELADKIEFLHMNAEALEFADDTFDVIVSRNVTWNLPDPEKAYRSWSRVLRPNGLMLNFDANWYAYLYDDEARELYERDRMNVEAQGLDDHYTCTDIDAMEDIAREMPLSRISRPAWDVRILSEIGMTGIVAAEDIGGSVWSKTEQVNYAATPMFMISAVGRDSLAV